MPTVSSPERSQWSTQTFVDSLIVIASPYAASTFEIFRFLIITFFWPRMVRPIPVRARRDQY